MASAFRNDRGSSGKRLIHAASDAHGVGHPEREQLQGIVSRMKISEQDRRVKCLEIGERVMASSKAIDSPNFRSIAVADLRLMAELYDAAFFEGACLSLARRFGMSFRWSSRMTSAGGKTIRTTMRDVATGQPQVKYEIALSSTLLFQTFSDLQRPIRVTGVLCTNRLQAMQRILEHEMVHLAEMLVWDESCCAAPRFQGIAHRMFSHTEHRHELITQQERAATKFNVRVGSMVTFQHEGKRYIGSVNRITRRATVLVCDLGGQLYSDGKRYRKFYVPIVQLKPVA